MIRRIKTFFEKRDIEKNGSKIKVSMIQDDGELIGIEFRAESIEVNYEKCWHGDDVFKLTAIGKDDIKKEIKKLQKQS